MPTTRTPSVSPVTPTLYPTAVLAARAYAERTGWTCRGSCWFDAEGGYRGRGARGLRDAALDLGAIIETPAGWRVPALEPGDASTTGGPPAPAAVPVDNPPGRAGGPVAPRPATLPPATPITPRPFLPARSRLVSHTGPVAPRVVKRTKPQRPASDKAPAAAPGPGTQERARTRDAIMAYLVTKAPASLGADEIITGIGRSEDAEYVYESIMDAVHAGDIDGQCTKGQWSYTAPTPALDIPTEPAELLRRMLRMVLAADLGREVGEDEELLVLTSQAMNEAAERNESPMATSLEQADPAALALCRYVFGELERRELVPEGLTFDSWLADAAWERAQALALSFLGFSHEYGLQEKPDLDVGHAIHFVITG